MDLFEHAMNDRLRREAPLAARMRPRTLDEFVGQGHIVGPGRLLRRAIQADQLSSVIFYGPPGTGKTTLASVIANTTRSHFITINAVLAGVKDIREAIKDAQDRRGMYNQRTILFVDEVHRFNKAQQDALLPWVENGAIILIGATTENPWFSVNRPLVSRSRVFQLISLTEDDLIGVARAALADPERGYGALQVQIREDALSHLVDVANGDARSLLNALELAVETTPANSDGVIVVDMAVAEESIQRRAVLYDKEGDYHFDTISAFIKSLRGSDPDAAMYWLAKMVYAGEDPRFIFRRMLIFAGEDVGLADPNAMAIVNACAEAFDRIGLPEGRFHLTQAALYLATAPKSNSAFAFFDALEAVGKERASEVPAHLKDANRDKEGFGHGEGYLYPHAYRDHWVTQQYLPDSLQGKIFYRPGEQGYERQIRDVVMRRREAQLAAMVEVGSHQSAEILTFSPSSQGREQWLRRAGSGFSRQLEYIRETLFDMAGVQRHHLLLDLNAGAGLLTWEALRRAPEGGVWALAGDPQTAAALREQADRLPELERPTILSGTLEDLPTLVQEPGQADLRFDIMVGRNVLTRQEDRLAVARVISSLLSSTGHIVLAEAIPRRAQRLYRLVDISTLGDDLVGRIIQVEESIYQATNDPMVNWDADDLERAFASAGLAVTLKVEIDERESQITPAQLNRWFDPTPDGQRKSYAGHLLASQMFSNDDLARYKALLTQAVDRPLPWTTTIAFMKAERRSDIQ
jgi:putative ATPase